MASNRIVVDTTKTFAVRIIDAITFIAMGRAKLMELNNEVGAYNADTSFQTDTGMSSSDQTKFVSLLANSVAELTGLTNVAVAQGGQTNIRQLIDQLGRTF